MKASVGSPAPFMEKGHDMGKSFAFTLTSLQNLCDRPVYHIYNWPFPADAGANGDYTRCLNVECEAKDVIFRFLNAAYNQCPHRLEMVNYRYGL